MSDKSTSKKKIMIIENHLVFRKGLCGLLNNEEDIEVCGVSGAEDDVLSSITRLAPDLLVLDTAVQDSRGISLINDVRLKLPRLPILVISMHEENFYIERVIRSGAQGYLTIQEAPDSIVTAVREILGGKTFIGRSL